MTDKKLTDEEIIEALECCGVSHSCYSCPLYGDLVDRKDCLSTLQTRALDLINRQKAENERLKGSVITNNIMKSQRIKKKEAKVEAYKEFAERLKKDLFYKCGDINYSETCDLRNLIDNLLKEMVGEEE